MRNGSQMGTEPTSSRKQVDIAEKAIGFDAYNQSVTGELMNTLREPIGGDNKPVVFTLKVRGGVEVDSKGKKAGKGALINENMAMTLGVSQDQTLFVPKFVNSSGGGYSGNA